MVTLRQGNKEDSEFVAKMILMALHMENGNMLRHVTELVNREETLYHWSRGVIAMDGEKRIGMCLAYNGCDYHERKLKSFTGDLLNQPDETGRGEFYVDSLAVLSEYRGKGIGRLLLTDAIKRGKSLELTPSILVLPDNLPAVKLYESVGFNGKEQLQVFGDTYRKMRVIC